MTATREETIDELRQWITATLDELNRTLEELRAGADPASIMPRLASSLSWSPLIDDLVRLINEPLLPEPARAAKARRVLVVDDSEGYRLLCTRVLSVSGYEVETTESGTQAWALLQQRSFDVVVTDAEMPEMDGLELVRLIRASRELAHLPVMLLTGRDAPEDEQQALAAGADTFLCKFRPDTLSVLLDRLERMVHGSRAAAER